MGPEVLTLLALALTAPPSPGSAAGPEVPAVSTQPPDVAAVDGRSNRVAPRATDITDDALTPPSPTQVRLSVGLLAQLDARVHPQGAASVDPDFGFRRLRVPVTATLPGWGAIVYTPELRDGRYMTFDAFIDLDVARGLHLRLGKWASPVGYGRLQPGHTLFALERGPTSHLAPVRDIGLAVLGRVGPVEFHAGLFDGAGDNAASDLDDDPCGELAARAAVHLGPLLLGASGSVGCSEGRKPVTPRAASGLALIPYADGTLTAGRTARIGGHLSLQGERFFVWAEVLASSMTLAEADGRHAYTHTGWQGALAVALTEHTPHFDGLRAPSGEPAGGGVEAAVTVGGLHPDRALLRHGVEAPDALVLQTSVNWYVNRAFKVQFNWEHTDLGTGRAGDDMLGIRVEAHLDGHTP
jgi:hypothetical protein